MATTPVVVTKSVFQAQVDSDFADNTNEDIKATHHRQTFANVSESTAFLAADETVAGNWTFDEAVSGVTGTANAHFVTLDQMNTSLANVRSTGIEYGGELSHTANVINVTAGAAIIFDDTDFENPITYNITWDAEVSTSLTSNNVVMYLYFDNTGAFTQTTTAPTGTSPFAEAVLASFKASFIQYSCLLKFKGI